ncbi:MAG: NUDIX domain-containing protein [Defluviitaleaceae bacterium]|nr:NUDIX domain-containing protein [Defluviitaleaceae bacterium]
MLETVSCGGVVIYKGKVLLLYKSQNKKYAGWVLPKGTMEEGETFAQTAAREVFEEASVTAKVLSYLGSTHYSFKVCEGIVNKTVHWHLMYANSYQFKPQREEFFADGGYYKKHEAFHLLKYNDERQMLLRAFDEYDAIQKKQPRPAKTIKNMK